MPKDPLTENSVSGAVTNYGVPQKTPAVWPLEDIRQEAADLQQCYERVQDEDAFLPQRAFFKERQAGLYHDVLRMIADGAEDPVGLARAALGKDL